MVRRWLEPWPLLLAALYLALIPLLAEVESVSGVSYLLGASALGCLLLWFARQAYPSSDDLPLPLRLAGDALNGLPAAIPWLPLPASLSWLAAAMARVHPPQADYYPAFGLWVAAFAVLLAIVFVPVVAENRDWLWAAVRAIPWPEVAAVAIITAAAFAVRFIGLSGEPAPFWTDEGDDAIFGLEVARGGRENLFDMGVQTIQPNLYYATMGLPFKLFGPSVLWARVPSALVGTATVPLLYLLLRETFDRRVALAGAAVLAVLHVHVHYSRMAFPNAYDAFFAVLVLYFALRAVRTGAHTDFAITGLAAGMIFYFYMGGRIVPLALALLLAFLVLKTGGRFLLRNFWGLGTLSAGFAIAVLPAALYFDGTPGAFTARWETQNIFDTGWLDEQVRLTGHSHLHVLWDQFQDALGSLLIYKDTVIHYNSKVPLLDAVSGVFFVVGGVYALLHLFQARFFALYAVFLLAIVFGATLLGPPVGSQRLLAAAAVSAAFVALGLVVAADAVARLLPRFPWLPWAGVGAALVVIALMNLSFYFDTYASSKDFGRGLHLPAAAVADYLEGFDSSYAVYIFDTRGLSARDGALRFRAWDKALVDVREDGRGKTFIEGRAIRLDDIDASRHERPNALFLVPVGRPGSPEHTLELEAIRRACPGGVESDVLTMGNAGEILYVWYEVIGAQECVSGLRGTVLPPPQG